MDMDCEMAAQPLSTNENDPRGDGVGFTVPTDRDWHGAIRAKNLFQVAKAFAHLAPPANPIRQRASDIVWSFYCSQVGEGAFMHLGEITGALLDSEGFALAPAQAIAVLSEPCGGPFPFSSAVSAVLSHDRPGNDQRMDAPDLVVTLVQQLVLDPQAPKPSLSLFDVLSLAYPTPRLLTIPDLCALAHLLSTHPNTRIPLASVVRYARLMGIQPQQIVAALVRPNSPFSNEAVSLALAHGITLSKAAAAALVWQESRRLAQQPQPQR